MRELLLDDIRESKYSILILIIQMTFTLLIAAFIFGLIYDSYQENTAMKSLLSNGRVVKAVESLDEVEFSNMTDKKSAELEELYLYLTKNDRITGVLSSIGLDFTIDINKTGKNLKKFSNQFLYYDEKIGTCEMAIVNDNFFDYYNITGDFTPEDKGNVIYLGNDFKGTFKKGDIIYDAYGGEYVVKGFLKKGAYYINPYESNNKYCLDSFFITPVNTDGYDGLDYMMMIESTMLILKDDSAYSELANKIDELGLKGITLRDYSWQKEYTVNEMLNEIITYSVIGLIVLLFATMSMVASLINYIRKNMMEFAVCMMCGATKRDIIIRVGTQLAVVVAAASMITLIWYKFSLYAFLACILGLLYGIAVLIYPSQIVKTLEITEIIRRK